MAVTDKTTEIKRSIRRALNEAVTAGEIAPDQALAILMTIAVGYVAQIDDDASRFAHVKMIEDQFGAFVEHWRTGGDAVLAMAEAVTETRQ